MPQKFQKQNEPDTLKIMRAKCLALREDIKCERAKRELAEAEAARWKWQALDVREVCAELLARLAEPETKEKKNASKIGRNTQRTRT